MGETIIISRTNSRANRFNQGIRNQLLFREEEISTGDILMVVKNNYLYNSPETGLEFIANGDIARLEKIHRFESIYNYRFADVTLSLIDYEYQEIEAKILIDTLNIESASLGATEQKAFFNLLLDEYRDIKNKRQRIKRVREDPYFNALQIKYAYAVTCHKAQGGQWKAVFIDPGYYKPEMLSVEYLRWLYTAFTRATDKLYLVNFPYEFFAD
jgi:exodeoxyribonuclease-5